MGVAHQLFLSSFKALPFGISKLLRKNIISNQGFVTRSGSSLILNGEPFRFFGCNISWLGCAKFSGGWAPPPTGTIGPPTKYRIDNVLETAAVMGCKVVRTFAGTVGYAGTLYPTLGEPLNEDVAVSLDYAIYQASLRGIKLIMVLIDHSYPLYLGGIDSFSYWGGTNEAGFYANTGGARDAFLTFAGLLINRTNTITGIPYNNDPTIMGWESGNELAPSDAWTSAIASQIKSWAPNHLFIDGKFGISSASLSNNNVDVVSNHHYPMSTSQLTTDVSAVGGAKPFIIGEFDWAQQRSGSAALSTWLTAVEGQSSVTGTLFWDLSSHGDEYGFSPDSGDYTNASQPTGDEDYDLRFGESNSTRRTAQSYLMAHAEVMNGASNPSIKPGFATGISLDGSNLIWKGVAGAWTYNIEKSSASNGGFITVDSGLTDDDVPWATLGAGWYRVRAVNHDGAIGLPSSPIQVA